MAVIIIFKQRQAASTFDNVRVYVCMYVCMFVCLSVCLSVDGDKTDGAYSTTVIELFHSRHMSNRPEK